MDVDQLVLEPGDRVRAAGRIIRYHGETWFEPPLPVPLPYFPADEPPPPRPSGVGVRATGVDLSALANRRDGSGATEGWTRLVGAWTGRHLLVLSQLPEPPGGPPPDTALAELTRPPCPEPAGGWPHGIPEANLDPVPADLLSSGTVVSAALFRPSATQVVLVVAATDPAVVEARLRPRYGDRLCVVRSRWSRGQVHAVHQHLRALARDWGVVQSGETVSADGQLRIHVRLVRLPAEAAAWAASVPDGLLAVEPWLAPVPA